MFNRRAVLKYLSCLPLVGSLLLAKHKPISHGWHCVTTVNKEFPVYPKDSSGVFVVEGGEIDRKNIDAPKLVLFSPPVDRVARSLIGHIPEGSAVLCKVIDNQFYIVGISDMETLHGARRRLTFLRDGELVAV